MADERTIDFEFDEAFTTGDAISESDALKILLERLPIDAKDFVEMGVAGSGEMIKIRRVSLAEKLLRLIPQEYRTDDVLRTGDLRALLSNVLGNEGSGEITVNGVEFTEEDRRTAALAFFPLNKRTRESVETALGGVAAESDTQGTGLAPTIDNVLNQYQDNKISKYEFSGRLQVDPETGEVSATEGSVGLDPFEQQVSEILQGLQGGEEKPIPSRFITGQDLQRMLQTGELSFDDVRDFADAGRTEFDPQTGEPIAYERLDQRADRILYSDEQTDRTKVGGIDRMSEGGFQESRWSGKDWYTLTEMTRLPNDMTRDEAAALHDKMKKAGIFDISGGEPVLPGDVTDPAFKRAWKNLMRMSMETGQSMTSILASRAISMEEEVLGSLATSLTDPARLRINADAYAREAIGRKLSEEEQAKMTEFIHGLERENALTAQGLEDYSTGEETLGVDPVEEGTMFDTDAQMQEFIEKENPDEAGAFDLANQYEQFTRMLAGPGRGI